MLKRNKKGVILFIVIGVIMVTIALSVVILRIISNQARLTHHQLSRIQAQYFAKAGVIYALDKLRRNDDATCWPSAGPFPYTRYMKKTGSGCDIIELDLPTSWQVDIVVDAPGTGPSGTQKVSAKTAYAYTL